jgi:hypothetical protein
MSPLVRKGLVVVVLHVALVASVGAKLLVDRATKPRVWTRAAPFDPDLPIRGRYVRLRLEAVPSRDFEAPLAYDRGVVLSAQDGKLVATPSDNDANLARISSRDGERIALLAVPVAYFIPEHIPDPSVRQPGEELWVEVTVPGDGPPRPIRLGIRRNGTITPLKID